ncbi:aminotransferase-like domain-containing protein [Cellulomonas wangsupingiae]|uniref:aminotransferase-like domain-containing protein n=1 Tax=Cellulomonas wangsupingiae TaxID=2968085 RepID=UPI001D0F3D72|nr:PLP-dependent aminotransferase family protein [Cellulomonas wangsupingiae]MCM0639334.1 PLP-dependent aminotransferase family protein [Cellulomonas wangsupingiae]
MNPSPDAVASKIADWRSASGPAHRRLSSALRLAVLDGRIAPGDRLPSERSLARSIGVSRTTVTTAYRELADSGFIFTSARRRPLASLPPSRLRTDPVAPDADVIDLSTASPLAPERHIHAAYSHALDRLPSHLGRTGYDRTGIPELRAAVARWFTARGLVTAPDQILITHGAQHALSLVAQSLLSARPRVLVEHPTYPNALELFHLLGARLKATPLLRGRDDLTQWRPLLEEADLVYVVPDFHNPTGTILPTWARSALRTSGLLVVDETMVTLGLDGRCLPDTPPVASFHPDAITIGSLSKSLWAGLRVGWLRAPRQLVARLARRRAASDLGNSVLDQLAVADLLDAGLSVDEQTSWQRSERCDHLRAALLGSALDVSRIERPRGGLSLWVQLEEPVAAQMAARANLYGLELSAGPRFSPFGAFQRHLRIPYTLPLDQLDRAIDRLVRLRSDVK